MSRMAGVFLRGVGLLVVACGSILAQGPGGGPPDGPDGPPTPSSDRQRPMRPPNARDMLNRLSRTLKLTDDQKTKIKPILDAEQQQLEDLSKSNSSRQEQMQNGAGIQEKTWAAMRPLLNQSQQKRLDAMAKRMAERREHSAAREDGDDVPPPPDGPPPGGGPPGGGGGPPML